MNAKPFCSSDRISYLQVLLKSPWIKLLIKLRFICSKSSHWIKNIWIWLLFLISIATCSSTICLHSPFHISHFMHIPSAYHLLYSVPCLCGVAWICNFAWIWSWSSGTSFCTIYLVPYSHWTSLFSLNFLDFFFSFWKTFSGNFWKSIQERQTFFFLIFDWEFGHTIVDWE